MVTIETATVYRGGRRRWLSLSAAVRAEAKELYRQRVRTKDRCDCEEGSYEGPGPHTCKYHDWEAGIRERFIRLVSRSIAHRPESPAAQTNQPAPVQGMEGGDE